MFAALKTKFPKQVLHFYNFSLVNPLHVVQWHQDLYDDSIDPEDYDFDKALPFLKAKKILRKIIEDRHATVPK